MHTIDSNRSVKEYFDTLPKMLQESIMQSGISFDNVDQMKNFVCSCEKRSKNF